jgi:hypothetical protein
VPRLSLNKAIKTGNGARAFVGLECGLTRGSLPQERVQHLEDELADTKQKAKALRQTLRAISVDATEGTLPDFLVVGAQRSGTTYLYDLLRRHPYFNPAARKEIHFFDSAKNLANGVGWYMSQFPRPEVKNGKKQITGEATPYYLCHPLAPRRAARIVPGAKLVVMLRNPVDRAYSGHVHHRRRGEESLSFEEAIEAEANDELAAPGKAEALLLGEAYEKRVRRYHSHLARGIYVKQLKEWQKYFSEDQILVIKSEDFFTDPAAVMFDVQRFVGLPDRHLDAGVVKNRNLGKYKKKMNPRTRERLDAYFAPYNKELYKHLGRDLGW